MIQRTPHKSRAKYSIHTMLHRQLGDAEANDMINKVSNNIPPPISAVKIQFILSILIATASTAVRLRYVLHHPSFNAAPAEDQVLHSPGQQTFFFRRLFSALWTSPCNAKNDYFLWSFWTPSALRSSNHSFLSYSWPDKDAVPLVIPAGRKVNLF